MSVDVGARGEISIGGVRFPTLGPVKVTNISVSPNPIIYGDTSKPSDTQVMSQITQSSHTGGSGIYKANPRVDIDRVWTSRADTRFRGLLSLPPLATDMGKPAGLGGEDVTLSLDYRNEQYFAFANKIYRWLDATATWSSSERTFATVPTDAIVFLEKLYVAYSTGYDTRDAAATWATVVQPARLFTVWDDRLWRLGFATNAWRIYASVDGTTWGAAVGALAADVVPHQLIVYRDAAGENVILVVTDSGLWTYDAVAQKFLRTEVRIPRISTLQTSKATVFRDGKLYFTSGGLGVLSVQSGNPLVVTPMGLDIDDGVPSSDDGKINAIGADFNGVLILVDSTQSTGDDDRSSGLAGPFDTSEWTESRGRSTLRWWNQGWHVLWESPADASSGTVIAVSSAYDKRRAYFGANQRAYLIDLPTTIYNPRQNPTPAFAPGPVSHVTPWYDMGTETQDKIQGHILLRTSRCTSTEKVTVYYGADLDDTTWTLLGEITSNGQWTFRPGGPEGLQGTFYRYRFDLQRGSDSTKSPIVEFWSSEFMRLLPATYGFAATIDLSEEHGGRTPAALLDSLKTLADPKKTPRFVKFSYQDQLDATRHTHYGRISRLTGVEWGGAPLRGMGSYEMSFMVPYTEDSVPGG